ncbi:MULTISPECIES: cytochrome C assembly family protein [Vibrio]|uniref:Inner membrane protein YpjD n=2 Tax=Vibrio TaxID=662 RepID=A0A7X4LH66_9VIBR|nr:MULTISPECIES: inner membrane protein YpjD [Vibrio]MBF9001486.1 inner membrane protein YpjD [Vibrio nitrifigilis]MZI91826.1 inner membrane protein YpjD [Vibrio eleionomae]
MDNLITVVAAVLYFVSIAMIVPGVVNQTGIKTKTVFGSAALAVIFHAWLLGDLIFHNNGQNLSILNVASVASFLISVLMTASMFKARLWFLLPIVYSFSAIILVVANFVPNTFMTHFEHNSALLIHISFALFSYSTMCIGALYAIQLAWLDHKLKSKKSLAINPNLPPLLRVERHLFKIIIVGEALLTGTLITGFWFITDMFAEGKAHKGILSFIAWVVYAILLWGHYQNGWRGKRVTWLSVLGAFILTLAYFGSRFVKEFILS